LLNSAFFAVPTLVLSFSICSVFFFPYRLFLLHILPSFVLSFFLCFFICYFSPFPFPLSLFYAFSCCKSPFLSKFLSPCFSSFVVLFLLHFLSLLPLFLPLFLRTFSFDSLIIMFVSPPHSFLACCSYEISVSHSPTLPITRSDWLIKAL